MDCIKSESTEGNMECIKSEPIEDDLECIKSETLDDNIDYIRSNLIEDEYGAANIYFSKETKKEKHDCNDHDTESPSKKMKEEPDDSTEPDTALESSTPALPIEFVGVKEEFPSAEDDHGNQQKVLFFVDNARSAFKQGFSANSEPGWAQAALKYSCSKCFFRTDSCIKLRAHNKTEKHYNCPYDYCPYIASFPSLLKHHNLAVHEKCKPYECQQCKEAFISKAALKKHTETAHYGTNPYKCKLCQQTFLRLASLNTHIRKFHEGKYQCPNCEFGTDDQSLLDSHHMDVHLNPYRCSLCSYSGASIVYLKAHVKAQHIEKEKKPLNCPEPECTFSTKNGLEYEEHWKSMHLKSYSRKCRACSFTSAYKEVLLNHIDTVHARPTTSRPANKLSKDDSQEFDPPKEDPLKCAYCKYVGTTPIILRLHVRAIHGDQKLVHQCLRCKFSTKSDSAMVKHAAVSHPGLKPFQCLDCGFTCMTYSNLSQHIKARHLQQKRRQCAICRYKTFEKKKHGEPHSYDGP